MINLRNPWINSFNNASYHDDLKNPPILIKFFNNNKMVEQYFTCITHAITTLTDFMQIGINEYPNDDNLFEKINETLYILALGVY